MYEYIIFDLDDTLSDNLKNVQGAFKTIVKDNYSEDEFNRFYNIDQKIWNERAEGLIKNPREGMTRDEVTEWIRAQRFIKYFGNITYNQAVNYNNLYVEGLKEKVEPINGAIEILEYLKEKDYEIVIATNGPSDALPAKLNKLKIDKFVDVTFAADECGNMKPHTHFYEALFDKINNHDKEKMLFIGDELDKDIKGGNEIGIDTCWFNFKNEPNSEIIPTYKINNLLELKNIL